MKKINVLGTEYTIELLSKEADNFLRDCDGYCDKTSKRIVATTKPDTNQLDNFDIYG